jgi:hypothetical protein
MDENALLNLMLLEAMPSIRRDRDLISFDLISFDFDVFEDPGKWGVLKGLQRLSFDLLCLK